MLPLPSQVCAIQNETEGICFISNEQGALAKGPQKGGGTDGGSVPLGLLSLSSFWTLVDLGPDLINRCLHSSLSQKRDSHHLSSCVFSGPGLWQVLGTPMGCELLAVERRWLLKGVSTLGQGPRHAEHVTDVSLSSYSYSYCGSKGDWTGFANVFSLIPQPVK